MKKFTPNLLTILVSISLWMMYTHASFAQKQPGIPRPRGPVDLSETANLIMFIILPALVIVGYFFWRSAYKKRKNRE